MLLPWYAKKRGLNNRSTYFTYFFKIKVKIQTLISLLENTKIVSINGGIEKWRRIGATPAGSTYYQLRYLIGLHSLYYFYLLL